MGLRRERPDTSVILSQKVPPLWSHSIYRQNPAQGTRGCQDETQPPLLHLLLEKQLCSPRRGLLAPCGPPDGPFLIPPTGRLDAQPQQASGSG